jgi:hypothetical protein
MAQIAATQGGWGGGLEGGEMPMGGAEQPGGFSISAGDVLGGAQNIAGLFSPGTGTAFAPAGETQTPAYQGYRAGERDLSTLGGTFLGQLGQPSAPGAFPYVQQPTLSIPGAMEAAQQGNLTFEMAPQLQQQSNVIEGGVGPETLVGGGEQPLQSDLLGGGLSTLGGLYSLYGGAQTGNVGQLLGGAGGTLAGLQQMAPETVAQLTQALGLPTGSLSALSGALGGLAGGYGLYQGIKEGDPLSAILGAIQLYQGGAPIAGLPGVGQLAGQGLQAISPELASALGVGAGTGGTLAGMTGAQTAAALGELGLNTALTGTAAGTAGTAGSAGGAAGAAAGGTALGAAGAGVAMALPFILANLTQPGAFFTKRGLYGDYPFFSQELMTGQNVANEALQRLYQGLPLARSKEELAGVIQAYNQALQQGLPTNRAGEIQPIEMLGEGPFAIGKITGAGDVVHGVPTGAADQGPFQNYVQSLITQLSGTLPGDVGQGDIWGRMTPEQTYRLAQQFKPASLPAYNPQRFETDVGFGPQTVPQGFDFQGFGQGLYGPETAARFLQPGAPEWLQGAQQYYGLESLPTALGAYGTPSAAWQQVTAPPPDPFTQALQRYQEQLGALTQQAPQLLQAAQTSLQGAPVNFGAAPAGGPNTGANKGIDLERLLRELGYLA